MSSKSEKNEKSRCWRPIACLGAPETQKNTLPEKSWSPNHWKITHCDNSGEQCRLVEDFTESLVKHLGKSPEHIHIVIDEVEEENWGYSGMLTDDFRKSLKKA